MSIFAAFRHHALSLSTTEIDEELPLESLAPDAEDDDDDARMIRIACRVARESTSDWPHMRRSFAKTKCREQPTVEDELRQEVLFDCLGGNARMNVGVSVLANIVCVVRARVRVKELYARGRGAVWRSEANTVRLTERERECLVYLHRISRLVDAKQTHIVDWEIILEVSLDK